MDRDTGSAPDPQELLARLRAGDDAAYDVLVRTHAGRLLAVARRMLRVEEDARDALQEAFLQAFRSIDRFEGAGPGRDRSAARALP